jgi:hypothetical protein
MVVASPLLFTLTFWMPENLDLVNGPWLFRSGAHRTASSV